MLILTLVLNHTPCRHFRPYRPPFNLLISQDKRRLSIVELESLGSDAGASYG